MEGFVTAILAVLDGATKSVKKAQLTNCKMSKVRLIDWQKEDEIPGDG